MVVTQAECKGRKKRRRELNRLPDNGRETGKVEADGPCRKLCALSGQRGALPLPCCTRQWLSLAESRTYGASNCQPCSSAAIISAIMAASGVPFWASSLGVNIWQSSLHGITSPERQLSAKRTVQQCSTIQQLPSTEIQTLSAKASIGTPYLPQSFRSKRGSASERHQMMSADRPNDQRR